MTNLSKIYILTENCILI